MNNSTKVSLRKKRKKRQEEQGCRILLFYFRWEVWGWNSTAGCECQGSIYLLPTRFSTVQLFFETQKQLFCSPDEQPESLINRSRASGASCWISSHRGRWPIFFCSLKDQPCSKDARTFTFQDACPVAVKGQGRLTPISSKGNWLWKYWTINEFSFINCLNQ